LIGFEHQSRFCAGVVIQQATSSAHQVKRSIANMLFGTSIPAMAQRIEDAPTWAARYGLVTMILTSVHHAYGAFIYNTPWRLHVVVACAVAVPMMFAALAAQRHRGRRGGTDTVRTLAFWSFVLITFVLPVAGIGIFEGVYNHVAKNLLYFGGAAPAIMRVLFPPGIYELPNDMFFEATGVLQTLPALAAGWFLVRMVRAKRSRARTLASI
jgi:ABC-type sugar transport system permease subunit